MYINTPCLVYITSECISLHTNVNCHNDEFLVLHLTDSQRFSEWTQHECYAEERREVFVKSADIENIFTALSDFANKSLTDSPRPVSGGRSSRSPVNNT